MSQQEATATRSHGGLRARLAPWYWFLRARARSTWQLDHVLVYVKDSGGSASPGAPRVPVQPAEARIRDEKPPPILSVIRLHATDQDGLDAITAGDPWGTGRRAAMDDLAAGHSCYVARLDGAVMAATWACTQGGYEDAYLDRTLALAPDEVYHFRTYAVQRGRGILPVLRALDQAVSESAATLGKRRHFGVVRPGNRPMRMLLNRLGFRLVGHIGFLDILGLRLSYIWGREAFPAIRPRLKLSARRFPSLRG